MVRSYSYGPHTLPAWDSFRSSSPINNNTTSSGYLLEPNANFLPPGRLGARKAEEGEGEEEEMEIEVSPATPPREWSPGGVEEDPHTMGEKITLVLFCICIFFAA